MLTQPQQTTLKADILADPVLSALAPTTDNAFAIAEAYKLNASPDFIVWRSSVYEYEFTDTVSAEGTSWSWPAFIARSLQEQNGWSGMFARGFVDPSKANVRQGFVDIFSGTSNSAPAQRAHCAAIAKRKANRLEKLFAVGIGSTLSPATMAVEGYLSYQDIMEAMGW